MKNITDLTQEELVALTDEEMAHYAKLDAAENGIPIPGEEPKPFDEQKPSHDIVLYVIQGIKFTDRAKAQELQDFLMARQEHLRDTDYNWSVGSHVRFVKGYEGELAITEEPCYSAERYTSLRESIDGWSERKKTTDEARKEWTAARDKFNRCIEHVSELVGNARRRAWREEENQARFDQYLELAGGDERLAWGFFEKAELVLDGFRPIGAPALGVAAE